MTHVEAGMTPREFEAIVQLVRCGSMKLAAAAMGTRPDTVRNQLQLVYSKLQVNAGPQAAARLWAGDAEFRALADPSRWSPVPRRWPADRFAELVALARQEVAA